ncbi:MAG TPA: ABC transporter ATP-binding protein [Acidimicrobiales bacterium]|nr:ABC transporter ATP-binding protein [Acidimicrobiales bacterium]
MDLAVGPGEAVAVLGRNGAGKSTTLKCIAGLLGAKKGSVLIDGEDTTRIPAERRASRGVALVPEGRGIFPRLTVRENLAMGAFHRHLRAHACADAIEAVTERFPRLRERLEQQAGSLSGGEQQMLALARGLMGEPRLLLVDEPSLGLAPVIVDQIYEQFAELRAEGLAVLVVEQYVEVALAFADRAYVLEKGRVAVSGDAAELAASPELVEVYLSGAPEEVLQ